MFKNIINAVSVLKNSEFCSVLQEEKKKDQQTGRQADLEAEAVIELLRDGRLQDDAAAGIHSQGDGEREAFSGVLDVSTQGLLFPSSHTGANSHCIDTGVGKKKKKKVI